MQKIVPPDGDTLDGRFVPGGTQIGYSGWGVHRDTNVFGSDADLYRPDRWIEAGEEQLLSMNRTMDLVFGSGRYACLGKQVALIEVSKAIAEVSILSIFYRMMLMDQQIFLRYDIVLIDPSRPWHSVNRNGLFLQSDMMVQISERECSSNR